MIIVRHSGELTASSAKPRGSIFRIGLPMLRLPTYVRCLDNRRPSSDFVFDERRERLLSPSCLFRNVTTQVGKPTANFLIIQGLVECIASA
jgi:hypothetical protein